jgi:hypothetical protein
LRTLSFRSRSRWIRHFWLAAKRPVDFVKIGATILSKQVDFNQDQENPFLEVLKALGRASRSRED